MITTYLFDYELQNYLKTEDKEIDELIAEINRLSPSNRLFVREFTRTEKRLFRKPVIHRYYSLYGELLYPEVQVVNFFVENSNTSINTLVKKDVVMAYLFGQIGGFNRANHVSTSSRPNQ